MMTTKYLIDEELDKNYDAFKAALPELMKKHPGRYVIVRDAKVLDAFDTSRDAYIFGWRQFKDDLFSVQEVTDKPVYLGILSHVLNIGPS